MPAPRIERIGRSVTPVQVWSKRKGAPPHPCDAVLVDRTTRFGNHFVVGRDGNRGECVEMFEDWILEPEQAAFRAVVKAELQGRDLVCWCAPKACHADVLLRVANS